MKTSTINISHIQKEIFWATAVLALSLVCLYVYFLACSISNVAVRQNLNEQVIALKSKVAQLEFSYVTSQNALTADTALANGFSTKSPVAYVSKDSGLSLARP